MNMKRLFITFLLAGVFLYLTALILAKDKNQLDFSHKIHVVEQEMECITCHEQAEVSETGRDDLLPSKMVCTNCHEEEEIGDPALLSRVEDYSVKFSHQMHLAAGLDCQSCHAGVEQKEIVGDYVLPRMTDCMSCHESRAVSVDCQTCHLPDEKLLPASHTANFIHNHGDMARLGAVEMSANMDCATCHKQQFCQDCHEGDNLDRLTHPLNYEFTHALDAQGKERDCAVCHTERSFCIDCHSANQVMPHDHTVGWTNRFDGGRHRVAALNDMDACIACHEQNAQQICQPCHGK